jgi:integral membrane protein (TIGR01906 family)
VNIVELGIVKTILKISAIIARWIFILCLPVLFFTAGIAWGFNSHWIFDYGFQKYTVGQITGIPDSELAKIGESWTGYINSGEEHWHIELTANGSTFELFTEDEQVHFKDVKQLVWLDYRAGLIVLIIVLAYIFTLIFWRQGRYRRYLAQSVIWGSGLVILLIIVLGIASILDFDRLFLQFHYLAFTNQNWSAAGYMLLLFPGGFWFDAAIFCIAFMAGLALVMGGTSMVYIRLTRAKSLAVFTA